MNKEKFDSLPKRKQARMVAYDVIQHTITRKNVNVVRGSYFSTPSTRVNDCIGFKSAKDEVCEVCAKGGVAYSYFMLSDSDEIVSSNVFHKNSDLENLFGESYHLMEYIFENGRHWNGYGFMNEVEDNYDISENDIDNFNTFCKSLGKDSHKDRLEQIMRNYLLNDKIDLSNHPHPDEELYCDEDSGVVTICNVHDTLNLKENE